jgi:hypothetical protein
MVLSNLSEKTLKTTFLEVKEDSLFIHDQLRKANEAALEFLVLLNEKFVTSDGAPHAGTILSAAAWLTGTSLYQSFQDKKISSPDTIITPQDVNREWEHLVYLLENYNFPRADVPVGRVVLAAMAAPPFFKPKVGMCCVQSELQEQYNTVMKEHGFDAHGGAHVGVILCSILIQQFSQAGMIDVEAATGVVAQRIFEATIQCILL